jgi:hypothetical protein
MMAKARPLALTVLATATLAFLGAACAGVLGIEDTLTFVGNDAGDAGTDSTSSNDAAAPSGIVWVQTKADSSITTLAFDRPVTAHNAIVVAMTITVGSGAPPPSMNDSLENRYSTVAGPHYPTFFSSIAVYVFAAFDVVDGPDTVTPTVSGGYSIELYIHEYAGLAAVDNTGSNDGQASGTDRTARARITTSAPNELLFAFVVFGGGLTSAGSGFTARSTFHNNVNEDRVVEAAGTYEATATVNNDSPWGMLLASFKGK